MITKSYVKEYFLRGFMFAGLGPIVAGIVHLILEMNNTKIELNGYQVFSAIVTTYIIAFVHAGTSVFPRIESWSIAKQMFFQFVSIYLVYTIGYLINSWIPFKLEIILIYTGCFVFGFLLIWLIAYLSVRATTKKMNEKLMKLNKELN